MKNTAEQRISATLDGGRLATTGRGLVLLMIVSVGIMIVFLGLRMGFGDGWTEPSFSGPVVLLFPVVTVALGLGYAAWTVRPRGRLAASAVLWILAVVLMGGGIALVSQLPKDVFPGPPNWVLPVAGALLLGLGLMIPNGTGRRLSDDGGWDSVYWFSRVDALLRGRYYFTRAEARAALAEQRAQWDISAHTGSPTASYGNHEIHAARLAAEHRASTRRSIRMNRWAWVAAALAWGALVGVPAVVTGAELSPFAAGAAVVWLVLLGVAVARCRPSRMARATAALQQRRELVLHKIDSAAVTDAAEL